MSFGLPLSWARGHADAMRATAKLDSPPGATLHPLRESIMSRRRTQKSMQKAQKQQYSDGRRRGHKKGRLYKQRKNARQGLTRKPVPDSALGKAQAWVDSILNRGTLTTGEDA